MELNRNEEMRTLTSLVIFFLIRLLLFFFYLSQTQKRHYEDSYSDHFSGECIHGYL